MKIKQLLSAFIGLLVSTIAFSQTSITIEVQPDPVDGKDATVSKLNPDDNHGDLESLVPYAWTQSNQLNIQRVFIEFNLIQYNFDSTFKAAYLSLYYDSTYLNNAPHDGMTNMLIQRVTSPWKEDSITWNNQPSTDTTNQVSVPGHFAPRQDWLEIDITDLFHDIIDTANTNYGLRISLADESPSKIVILGSSDNPRKVARPKLTLEYTPNTNSLKGTPSLITNRMTIYPLPVTDKVNVDLDNLTGNNNTLKVLNINGQVVKTIENVGNGNIEFARNGMSQGMYLLQLLNSEGIVVEIQKFLTR